MQAERRAGLARHWTLGAALAATLLAAAACGGTQGIPDQLTLNPGPGSEVQTNLLARQAAANGQGTTGGNNAQSPFVTPPTVAPGRSAKGSGGAFCRDIADQLGHLPNLFNVNGPEDLKSQLDPIRAKNAKILQEAPAAIKGSLLTVIHYEDRIYDDATSNNLQDIVTAISNSTFQSALQRVQLYASEHCGVTPPIPGSDTTPTT
jgi:hypothetical protein